MVPVDRQSKADTRVWNCWLMVLAVLLTGAADVAAQAVWTHAPAPSVPALDALAPTASAWPPATPGGWPRLRIPDPVERQAARKALDLAWQRLRALAADLPTYLTIVVFIDGSRETPCVTGVFAFTAPGSRVVRLCVDEIKRTWQQDREHTLASFIHEMLHTLGLDENPPSSAEITRRVIAGCRGRR